MRKLHRIEEAAEAYSAAIALSPPSLRLFNNRAYCLAKLGRYAEAVADYSAVLQLEPRNAHALQNRYASLRASLLLVTIVVDDRDLAPHALNSNGEAGMRGAGASATTSSGTTRRRSRTLMRWWRWSPATSTLFTAAASRRRTRVRASCCLLSTCAPLPTPPGCCGVRLVACIVRLHVGRRRWCAWCSGDGEGSASDFMTALQLDQGAAGSEL